MQSWDVCGVLDSLYIYQYGEDVSVKQHQYHIVWNYQHLYFKIYYFFIGVVYKIYVCTNKKSLEVSHTEVFSISALVILTEDPSLHILEQ